MQHVQRRPGGGIVINRPYSAELLPRLTVCGKKLREIDLKTAHVYLLAHFIEDETCKQNYLDWLDDNEDVYSVFIEGEMTEKKRDKMKGALQQALTARQDEQTSKIRIQLFLCGFRAALRFPQTHWRKKGCHLPATITVPRSLHYDLGSR